MIFTSKYVKMRRKVFFIFLLTVFTALPIVQCQEHPFYLTISTHDLTILVNETKTVTLELRGTLNQNVNVTLIKQHDNLIDIQPEFVFINKSIFPPNKEDVEDFDITGLLPGHLEVAAHTAPNESWIGKNVFMRITIANSNPIIYVSLVFGWIYFAAWSISFYPQIFINFRRRSVVGLNFDFLSLNIVGFALYSVFNVALFWSPEIQNEYFQRHPRGLNPVLINDVFFSLHAMFATMITIVQCFLYERADQKVSLTAKGILGTFLITLIISAILSGTDVIHWLDFLYICSYVKLAITLIKYIPQAVMNYRRKSTSGWSIGNVLLDFTGGMLSMTQMILNAYNYDDWASIFGDPTKFGLGLFSVCFDILFILQHYVFYRRKPNEISISEATTVDDSRFQKEVY